MTPIPWYRSNTLRALIVAGLAMVLQFAGFAENLEAEAGRIVDLGLQLIEAGAVIWAGYARIQQPTPPITAGAAAKMKAM